MKKSHTFYIGVFVSLAYSGVASALSFETLPEPPTNLVVIDTPDDAGNSVELDWALSGTDIFNPLNENASDTDPSAIVSR